MEIVEIQNKFGIIDSDGNFIIAPVFDEISWGRGRYLKFKLDGKWAIWPSKKLSELKL